MDPQLERLLTTSSRRGLCCHSKARSKNAPILQRFYCLRIVGFGIVVESRCLYAKNTCGIHVVGASQFAQILVARPEEGIQLKARV